ncbi:hypothetical protein O1M54_19145 [Streptomyces diastatochromogenes]|nr:hypothetical protein [Streptomyces diastatochromogenes]
MSTDREHEAEAYGAPGAGGEPGAAPNVYHPRAASAPSYEEYGDPAAAHGWQNAYDETRELPAVPAMPAVPRCPRRTIPPGRPLPWRAAAGPISGGGGSRAVVAGWRSSRGPRRGRCRRRGRRAGGRLGFPGRTAALEGRPGLLRRLR